MRKKIRTFGRLLLFGVLFFQLQPSLYSASNSDTVNTGSSNKIAVTAVGEAVTSDISMIAGKAPYYLIFDVNGIFLKSVANPGQSSGRNSSAAVVDLLLRESCTIVIAGEIGNKLKNQLKANKIEYYEREGIARSVVQTFVLDHKTLRQTR